jgi:RimJ/RimL family protein N-acetyltransferase
MTLTEINPHNTMSRDSMSRDIVFSGPREYDYSPFESPAMIEILPTAEAYADSFHSCLDAVARERRYLGFVAAPPVTELRKFVRMVVAAKAAQVLALDGETVVGWCDVLPKALEGFAHIGVLGMGVAATHRGRGIGERLARAAIEHARLAGLERVELDVFASNRAAIALYEKLGFAHEGVKRRAHKLDGVYDDVVIMAIT